MTMDFLKHIATRLRGGGTPQSEPIPGSAQVPNSAGGFAWALGPWERLDRFLVLGSEGGTYYVSERTLTRENAASVVACLAEDGPRVVRRVVELSASGRAPRNDPALFVLAMAAGAEDAATRAAALAALPQVARTGTHLFQFLRYVEAFRGWGRGVRRAVGAWYTARDPRELAYQLLKYPQRGGWSHRDALRLAHPKPVGAEQAALFRRTAARTPVGEAEAAGSEALAMVRAVEAMHADAALTPARAARLVREHRLTREMLPSQMLIHAEVWEALLEEMPMTAMLRSLGVMGKAGLLAPGSDAARTVADRLRDAERLRSARVHPVAVLAALRTYAQGHGFRGQSTWTPVAQVTDALDAAFYLAFQAVQPTGKRVMLALDVSASMTSPILGMPFLSCREGSAAMALVTAATEEHHFFTMFASGSYPSAFGPASSGLSVLDVSPRQRLDDVVKAVSGLRFGGTDCSLPMTEAEAQGWQVDTFVVYTDSETWAGRIHPAEALRRYRDRTGIAARLVVVGMASNGFTIADPEDPGMLDVVGFDASAPQMIADFAR